MAGGTMLTSRDVAPVGEERAEPAPRLSFRDINLRFPDGTHALHGINLDVAEGEFISLIGPSGCGKSTLLRLASGLLSASSGTVSCEIAGLGYVFQDPTLLPWRTVQRNVELFAELHEVPKAERAARARQALETVGLADAARKFPKALSGGMRSRVSLARSLILQPTLFLFDEPFAAVDEITRERLNEEIARLFCAQRFAAAFVTHSIAEACYLASRVVVMTASPGRIHAMVDVPFPYPRTPEMRYDPAFFETTKQVSALLREGEARGRGNQ